MRELPEMVNGFLGLSSGREAQKERDRDGGSPFSAVNPVYFPSKLGERERAREVSPDITLLLPFNIFSLFFKFCLCVMARYTWRDLNGLHVTGRGFYWNLGLLLHI